MIKDILDKNEKVKINDEKIERLKQLLPNCFDKNGKLEIEILKMEFKDKVDFTNESYELNFLGKSYAKFISALDTETVIEPDIEHNMKEENKNSENIYITGDNLDGLKHLLKAYEGKIKCIYIDPPYNTGKDGFSYNDTFKFTRESLIEKLDITEAEADRILNMTSNNSSSHSAWLTFMYPRLKLGQQLLSEEGVIFISIDDSEQTNLRYLCNMIFGEENYIANLPTVMNLKGNNDEFGFAGTHEYTISYAKNKLKTVIREYEIDEDTIDEWEEDEIGLYKKGANLKATGVNAPREKRPNLYFPIYVLDETPCGKPEEGKQYRLDWSLEKRDGYNAIYPITNEMEMSWRWSKEKFQNEYYNVIIVSDGKDGISFYKKQRPSLGDIPTKKPKTLLYKPEYSSGNGTARIKELFGEKVFSNPKPVNLIEDLISLVVDDDDYVLDFFSGSATSSDAIMKYNSNKNKRIKYIAIQIDEKIKLQNNFTTIDEIGRKRIELAAKKIKEKTKANIDYGFKHYTLKNTSEDLLNKMEKFNPEMIIADKNVLLEYGKDTVLETWKLADGYKFDTNISEVELDDYITYRCNDCLYMINPDLKINNIQSLLDKYNKDEKFTCSKLVIFGYSFRFDEIEMIKNNIKQTKNLKNSIDVKVYTRY